MSSVPSPPPPRALHNYTALLQTRIAAGSARQLVFPNIFFSLLLTAAYLCIPHVGRPWVYRARWLVVLLGLALDLHCVATVSSVRVQCSFAAGLIAVFNVCLTWTWLVWTRPQWEARRIRRRKRSKMGSTGGEGDGGVSTAISSTSDALTSRYVQKSAAEHGEVSSGHEGWDKEWEYYWQPYPMNSIWERMDWVFDLLANFRGQGWSWSLSTNPPLPAHVQSDLEGRHIDPKSIPTTSSAGTRRFDTRGELLRHILPRFIAGYLVLDLLKVLLMKDPYFILGPNDYALPKHLAWMNPLCLKTWREIEGLAAIYTALTMIFILSPLFFHVILGPKFLGINGEIWQYPWFFGDGSIALTKGLSGVWNGLWHQCFRQIFAAPMQYLTDKKFIKPGTTTARMVGLAIAFSISGLLHGAGSITLIPPTRPWNSVLFFLLQGVGVAVQTSFCSLFEPQIRTLPVAVRKAGNLTFVYVWSFYTSPLLLDDLARGGIWLYEPVPISPLRGLGFGQEGDGWWWINHAGWWYTGKHWWESGLPL